MYMPDAGRVAKARKLHPEKTGYERIILLLSKNARAHATSGGRPGLLSAELLLYLLRGPVIRYPTLQHMQHPYLRGVLLLPGESAGERLSTGPRQGRNAR